MVWLTATYRPVTLFSLRASQSTSSGGRTNLVPTMYAIKMALVDASYRSGEDGSLTFNLIKDIAIRFEPPAQAVISNTFIKIRREPKGKGIGIPAYISTIGFREFCYYSGDLRIAFRVDDDKSTTTMVEETLSRLCPRINYMGKRGSIMQFTGFETMEELPPSFGVPLDEIPASFAADMIVQYLDDLGKSASWQRVNSYSEDRATLGKDRVFVAVAIPYRRMASSRGYTFYTRSA